MVLLSDVTQKLQFSKGKSRESIKLLHRQGVKTEVGRNKLYQTDLLCTSQVTTKSCKHVCCSQKGYLLCLHL